MDKNSSFVIFAIFIDYYIMNSWKFKYKYFSLDDNQR